MSYRFIWIAVVIIAIIFILKRMKKNAPRYKMLSERQIGIRGTRVLTFLEKDTPITCLLDHYKVYGEDFKDKNLPALPHCENCKCEYFEYYTRSREWFDGKSKKEQFNTDLGKLDITKARYYKFALLLKSGKLSKEEQKNIIELLSGIQIDNDFKEKVETHIA